MRDLDSELFWAIVAVAVSAAALFVAMLQFFHPLLAQHRARRILVDELGRGRYDKQTIERSTRYYIPPRCSNIDPAQEQQHRHALIATDTSLFDKLDSFLDEDSVKRHLLILADSGTGKTSCLLNYYARNARRRRKRHRIALVPLGTSEADADIASLPDQESTNLFLDAFDEDTKAITDHRQRIIELMARCSRFRRVVITCRTQFFPTDEEIPVETGIVRIGPRPAGESPAYEFWKLYLSPFNDGDIQSYIRRRYPPWRWHLRRQALNMAQSIKELSARPMLLAHIPDLIAGKKDVRYACQAYETMIDAWLERERHWVPDKDALRRFSEQLAVDLYCGRERRGVEAAPRAELRELAEKWQVKLDGWQLGGRSLLNRDALGYYRFAHRSIMEYLFVMRMLRGDRQCNDAQLTDQMKMFLADVIKIDQEDVTRKRRNMSRQRIALMYGPSAFVIMESTEWEDLFKSFDMRIGDVAIYDDPQRNSPMVNRMIDGKLSMLDGRTFELWQDVSEASSLDTMLMRGGEAVNHRMQVTGLSKLYGQDLCRRIIDEMLDSVQSVIARLFKERISTGGLLEVEAAEGIDVAATSASEVELRVHVVVRVTETGTSYVTVRGELVWGKRLLELAEKAHMDVVRGLLNINTWSQILVRVDSLVEARLVIAPKVNGSEREEGVLEES